MRLTLFPKLLLSYLFLSLVPLVWLSVDATRRIGDVGQRAVEQSTTTLDAKAEEALQRQTAQLARSLSVFLEGRARDAQLLAEVPPVPQLFLRFARLTRGSLWTRSLDAGGAPVERTVEVPLYSEIARIDADGRELFRVDGDALAARNELRNVASPQGTTFGVEDYFRAVRRLPRGEVYVGHLVGRHVSMAEQLAGARTVEEAAGGREYRGHVRFAVAVWRGSRFDGAVVLALDHRHLMEFTQHVLPLSQKRVVFPSYLSGNYAFLFDDQGWMIAHPKFWDIRGLDAAGAWVPAYTQRSSKSDVAAGRIPFRLDDAGFVHPSYPAVAQAVRAGRSGVVSVSNVSGVGKVMAYAPVFFRHGGYSEHGVFGGVTIGALTEAFHREATASGLEIRRAARATLRTGLWIAWVLALLVTGASLLLSRAVARPIHRVATLARRIAQGELSARVEVRGKDEVGELARDFNRMAELLEEKDRRLRGSLEDLALSRDAAEAYAARLEEQLRVLRHIQSISEVLGTTFDREEVLRTILNTCVEGLGFARAALYVVDPGGERLRCLALAGYSPEEMEAALATVYSLKTDPLAPVLAIGERRTLQADDGRSVYVPMTIRDAVVGVLGGEAVWGGPALPEHAVGALQIVAGQAARAIERARLFEAARRGRDFVEAVVASIASGLITLDSSGRLLSANPYARKTLGLSLDGDLGKTLEETGVSRELTQRVAALLGGAAAEPGEFELPGGDGTSTFTWVPSRFETEEGPGLIVQFRDITAEKALGRTLERIDRLASLGRLAAGVAHEVRNPLTGISLALDDLHDRLDSESDRSLIARALQEIERLEGIVQGLLDYARVSPVERRRVSLGDVIEGSLFLVQKAARNQGVDIGVETSPDLPAVRADPEKLKQALLNLFLNALQAMPGGGCLAVTAEEAPGGVCIRVTDTGEGIPESDREKIFEPFYSLRPGGSGLGLSIAHTIVTDHGGRIEVSSAPGEGTQFRIFLPAS